MKCSLKVMFNGIEDNIMTNENETAHCSVSYPWERQDYIVNGLATNKLRCEKNIIKRDTVESTETDKYN